MLPTERVSPAREIVERASGETAVAAIVADLIAYYRPVGPVEASLVEQMAVAMAACRLASTGQRAAVRTAITNADELLALLAAGAAVPPPPAAMPCTCEPHAQPCPACRARNEQTERAIALALASEPVAKTARHTGVVTQTFSQLLRALDRVQQNRKLEERRQETCTGLTARGAADAGIWVELTTEAACIEQAHAWRRTAAISCPQCSSMSSPLPINGRHVLQCRDCGHQVGLRHGTIMADSNLPFLAWFRLVRLLAVTPDATLNELQTVAGIQTKATARRLKTLILDAFADAAVRDQILALCGLRTAQQNAAGPHMDRGDPTNDPALAAAEHSAPHLPRHASVFSPHTHI